MKSIVLVCAGGFSTSFLVIKMEKSAKAKGIEVLIQAVAEQKFSTVENETDIVLLGPQVSYLIEDFKTKYEPKGIKVGLINGVDYGMMNGDNVLTYALNM